MQTLPQFDDRAKQVGNLIISRMAAICATRRFFTCTLVLAMQPI
jgi:hypothetical protein